jgi:hypothetical protein
MRAAASEPRDLRRPPISYPPNLLASVIPGTPPRSSLSSPRRTRFAVWRLLPQSLDPFAASSTSGGTGISYSVRNLWRSETRTHQRPLSFLEAGRTPAAIHRVTVFFETAHIHATSEIR